MLIGTINTLSVDTCLNTGLAPLHTYLDLLYVLKNLTVDSKNI
ncbi:hypothetical protein FH603_5886 [Spirosoma sp. LMG 31447]|uniref:Uncharacterized protein n=1 Tax=Spirosoma utsteinense TaxID=2585773 RepID=A0ABR6WG76_9BACT|nr:hypothetical protein [Spirosoma utsteinense]